MVLKEGKKVEKMVCNKLAWAKRKIWEGKVRSITKNVSQLEGTNGLSCKKWL